MSSKTLSSIAEESETETPDASDNLLDNPSVTPHGSISSNDPCLPPTIIYEIDNDQPSSDPHASRPTVNSGEPLEPPADHPPSVFAVSTVDPDQHTLAEHGPDLVGGKVSVDPATFTTRVALHCGPSATTPAKCVSLLDSGSPQTFIRESMWEHMKQVGAASDVCEITTQPRVWGFGDSTTPLTTRKSVRLSVQFFHNTVRSASLAVWAYVVPDSTMAHALLLGRDSYMRFDKRTYCTLPPIRNILRHVESYTLNILVLSLALWLTRKMIELPEPPITSSTTVVLALLSPMIRNC